MSDHHPTLCGTLGCTPTKSRLKVNSMDRKVLGEEEINQQINLRSLNQGTDNSRDHHSQSDPVLHYCPVEELVPSGKDACTQSLIKYTDAGLIDCSALVGLPFHVL